MVSPRPDDETVMTLEQWRLLNRVLKGIIECGDGEGEVRIVVKNGLIRFIEPSPRFDITEARQIDLARWEQVERLFRRNHR